LNKKARTETSKITDVKETIEKSDYIASLSINPIFSSEEELANKLIQGNLTFDKGFIRNWELIAKLRRYEAVHFKIDERKKYFENWKQITTNHGPELVIINYFML
jgi:hypothetical protein